MRRQVFFGGVIWVLLASALGHGEELIRTDLWDKTLKRFVKIEGAKSSVRYGELKKNPADLSEFLTSAERLPKAVFEKLSEFERLAFLINLYNALTLKLILDHYPVGSIKDIGGVFSSPWKIKFFRIFGKEEHLNQIEHEMIRKNFSEPRIHFALVCASKGCPALRNEAYRGERLPSQLQSATADFLNDPERNRFDADKNELHLSMIFKWYKGDFLKQASSLQEFVLPLLVKDPEKLKTLQPKKVKIKFLDYDYSLNGT